MNIYELYRFWASKEISLNLILLKKKEKKIEFILFLN